jgi:hypothetical protein
MALDTLSDNTVDESAVAGLVAVNVDSETKTETETKTITKTDSSTDSSTDLDTDGKASPIVGDDIEDSYNDKEVKNSYNEKDIDIDKSKTKIEDSYNKKTEDSFNEKTITKTDSSTDNDTITKTTTSTDSFNEKKTEDSFNEKYEDSFNEKYEHSFNEKEIKDSYNDDSLDFKHIKASAGVSGQHDVLNGDGNDMSFNIGQINKICDDDTITHASVTNNGLGEFSQANAGAAAGGANTTGANTVGDDGSVSGDYISNGTLANEAFTQNIVMGAHTIFNSVEISVVGGNDVVDDLLEG